MQLERLNNVCAALQFSDAFHLLSKLRTCGSGLVLRSLNLTLGLLNLLRQSVFVFAAKVFPFPALDSPALVSAQPGLARLPASTRHASAPACSQGGALFRLRIRYPVNGASGVATRRGKVIHPPPQKSLVWIAAWRVEVGGKLQIRRTRRKKRRGICADLCDSARERARARGIRTRRRGAGIVQYRALRFHL